MAYTPTLWAKGDIVTSEKLNKIEQGIVDKVDKVDGKTLSTNDFTNEDKTKLDGLESQIDHLESLVGSPLVASTAAEMTDEDKVYVYTGSETGYQSGNWYYYNGTSWVSGGVYNSVAFETDDTLSTQGMAADAKKTGDEISTLKEELTLVTDDTRNIFRYGILESVDTWERHGNEYHGSVYKMYQAFHNTPFPIEFESGAQYTISYEAKTLGDSSTSGNGFRFMFKYSDDSISYTPLVANNQTSYIAKTATSTSGKSVVGLYFDFGSANNTWYIKNLQLAKGSSETKYIQPVVANDEYARENLTDNDAVNLCSVFGLVAGYLLNTGAVSSQTAVANEYTSEFIPVTAGDTYTFIRGASIENEEFIGEKNLWGAWAFYDSNKDFISRTVSDRIVPFHEWHIYRIAITIPSGTAYIRISARHYNNGFMMLYKGTILSPYLFPAHDTIGLNTLYRSIQPISDQLNTAILHENVKSVNHAGWYKAPENTLVAYKQSKLQGFQYVECDVQFTSDNVPVLLHDNTINRTARNADGTAISEDIDIVSITYAQAQEYDFGFSKGSEYTGTKIPKLEDFLILCRNLGLHPYIEIKSRNEVTSALVKSCVDLVKACGMQGKVTWISFSSGVLNWVKNNDPSARLGYVASNINATKISTAESLKTDSNEVFIDSSTYTAEEIALCVAANIPLEIWTIDIASTIKSADPYITGVTSSKFIASKILYDENIT